LRPIGVFRVSRVATVHITGVNRRSGRLPARVGS
jgi:hypothetical protein